jgi:hypothetical protein
MFVYSISIASLARPVAPVQPDSPAEAGAPAPVGAAVWLMIIPAIAVCVWAAAQSAWPSWRMLFILAGAGTLLYFVARSGRDRRAG